MEPGKNPRKLPYINLVSDDNTAELVDFLKVQARKHRAKIVARMTGLSVKAVENLRMGRSGASGKTITNWCKSSTRFRSDYFHFCGGMQDGEAGSADALTRAAQRAMNSQRDAQ